jgi:hypothetical protein
MQPTYYVSPDELERIKKLKVEAEQLLDLQLPAIRARVRERLLAKAQEMIDVAVDKIHGVLGYADLRKFEDRIKLQLVAAVTEHLKDVEPIFTQEETAKAWATIEHDTHAAMVSVATRRSSDATH